MISLCVCKTRPDFTDCFYWASFVRSSQFDRAWEENHEPGKNCLPNYRTILALICKNMICKTIQNFMIFHQWQRASRAQSMQNMRAREQNREHRARGLALKSGLEIGLVFNSLDLRFSVISLFKGSRFESRTGFANQTNRWSWNSTK